MMKAPAIALIAILWAPKFDEAQDAKLLEELKGYRPKIVCESFQDNNFELILMDADGSNPVNLTKTPEIDELYPKASPDGTKIAFLAEEGKGEARRRDLYVMNVDGTGRKKIGENARDPAWSPDGKKIAYLKGEFDKHTVVVFATKKLFIHDLAAGETREHANKDLEHLFSLDWSSDGRWFVTTVHGGMGFSHSILAIEAEGKRFFDLKLRGCRPDLAPGGRKVTWGWGDYAIGIADLDLNAAEPIATNHRKAVVSKEPIMTYHMDWSPDARYIVFTRGPKSAKKMLEGATRETPGVQAPGWDLCVCDPNGENRWVQLTSDGLSYKEPDWVAVAEDPSSPKDSTIKADLAKVKELKAVKDGAAFDEQEEIYLALVEAVRKADRKILSKEAKDVDYAQFSKDPSALRGQPIRLRLLYLQSSAIKLKKPAGGIETVYRTYLSTADGKEGYVVDLLESPGSIEPRRTLVSVDAVFFKRAGYEGKRGPVEAPLLIGHNLSVVGDK